MSDNNRDDLHDAERLSYASYSPLLAGACPVIAREVSVKEDNTSRRGFTLIELLVVIAVIALLISILSPSLRVIMRLAEQMKCATNLSHFATAMAGFSADNDQRIVSCMEWVRETKLDYEDSGWSWGAANPSPWRSDEYVQANNHARDPLQNGKLWQYIGLRDAYVCPTYASLSYPHKNQGGYGLQFTYAMNGHMDHLWYRDASPSLWYKRLSDIRNPGKVYLMGEEMPYGTPGHSVAGLNDGVLRSESYPGGDALGYMHGEGTIDEGTCNAVFVDAHVRTTDIWESYEITFDPR